jgi:hypothetical protein
MGSDRKRISRLPLCSFGFCGGARNLGVALCCGTCWSSVYASRRVDVDVVGDAQREGVLTRVTGRSVGTIDVCHATS